MDTITHGLFGITLYGAINKEHLPVQVKRGLLAVALVGSQTPDIDVIAGFTETGAIMSQMWHRGLTHSIFLVPVWGFLLYWLASWIFKVRDRRFFYYGMLAVFIHDTIDLFNAWGTGYLEPFSSVRLTIGTIPIVDLVFWSIFLIGMIVLKVKKQGASTKVFRVIALAMLLHFSIQTTQGLIIESQAQDRYDQTELAASFIPWHYKVIGKKDDQIEIYSDSLFTEPKLELTLTSNEKSDLTPLFEQNPKAKVLSDWSPFVVIVDNDKHLGIFDPRFYRNGESMLYEYIEKKSVAQE
ncbi:metal-dependent hydrolase [Hazenella coriacea]|uniref:Inner membrane protein n=1 Tax=Hazenella coriacea TaxID=1179467 RepID=A0A4R3LBN5_9BACL|nr:metal-dependent hydrolase [Hazenella coriacea]TCS94926.1 inner membrane protein [Hazenella coriacea]